MEVDLKIIGNNIFRYRQERKLSQKKLSTLMKKAEATISRIERGVKAPSMNTLIRFSEILNVSVDDLLDGTLTFRRYDILETIENKNYCKLLNELHNATINQKILVLNMIKAYVEIIKNN